MQNLEFWKIFVAWITWIFLLHGFNGNFAIHGWWGNIFLVIGDWGQNWLVIWWFQEGLVMAIYSKNCGDLVILTKNSWWFGDSKKVWWWWFNPKNCGDLVILAIKSWWFGDLQVKSLINSQDILISIFWIKLNPI